MCDVGKLRSALGREFRLRACLAHIKNLDVAYLYCGYMPLVGWVDRIYDKKTGHNLFIFSISSKRYIVKIYKYLHEHVNKTEEYIVSTRIYYIFAAYILNISTSCIQVLYESEKLIQRVYRCFFL